MNWRFVADVGERAGRSFIQGFFGLWLANPSKPVDFDTLFTTENLKAGIVMAVLSIAMALLGKGVNNPDSASVLPAQAQPGGPALSAEDAAELRGRAAVADQIVAKLGPPPADPPPRSGQAGYVSAPPGHPPEHT